MRGHPGPGVKPVDALDPSKNLVYRSGALLHWRPSCCLAAAEAWFYSVIDVPQLANRLRIAEDSRVIRNTILEMSLRRMSMPVTQDLARLSG